MFAALRYQDHLKEDVATKAGGTEEGSNSKLEG